MIRLNPNENLVALYRRHPLILWTEIIIIFLIALLFLGIFFFLRSALPFLKEPPYQTLISWVAFLFYHGLFIAFFVVFADYWLDIWIITTERVIDIEQKGLFRREVSEFKLDKIQDVSFDIRGILPSLFDFGDVQIETAGKERNLTFKTIPHPRRVKNLLLKMHDEYVDQKVIEEEWMRHGENSSFS